MADGGAGLQVIDVSNPSNCVLIASYDSKGSAYEIAVTADRVYVADFRGGLLVLPSIANLQHALRIDATPTSPSPSMPPPISRIPIRGNRC